MLVPDPPDITQAPTNITLLKGNTVNFTCTAIGQPAPNITWITHRYGVTEDINPYNYINYYSYNTTVSMLTISRVTPALAGEYVCNVTNIFGTDTNSAHLLVYSKLPKLKSIMNSV